MGKLVITDRKGGAALSVRLLPRSSRSKIVGVTDDGILKVKLTASPVDGKANKELIKLLSKKLSVAKTRIEIVAGHTSQNKLIAITGVSTDFVNKRIAEILTN